MQFSRASEQRGILGKGRVIGLVVVMGLIVAGAVTFFSGALDATPLSDEAPRVAQAAGGESMTAPTESRAADLIDVEPINLDYINGGLFWSGCDSRLVKELHHVSMYCSSG